MIPFAEGTLLAEYVGGCQIHLHMPCQIGHDGETKANSLLGVFAFAKVAL